MIYLKKCQILYILALFCILPACASGPKLTVYISNPKYAGMDWHDQRTGKSGLLPFEMTDKFFCLDKPDLSTLLNYCRSNKPKIESGPMVTVYISTPESWGMVFYNKRTEEKGFVSYEKTDQFTCLNPNDTQILLEYCGARDLLIFYK